MPPAPYLYAKPNPHAPRRANGIRFHGYPERREPVRLIVVHTAESTPDTIGQDGGAEAVASFQSRVERPSSYHEIGDSDSFVTMLPDEAVAFGARGANADGWHWSFATRAYLWPSKPAWWQDGALKIAAGRCRLRADSFGIPVRRLSLDQIADGHTKGFASHADTETVFGTKGRRSDPGAGFPWGRFLDLIRDQEDDVLKRGDENDDVKGVQRRLKQLGHYDGKLDGDFGPKTEAAVLAYQQRRKLEVSGRVSLWTAVDLQGFAHSKLAPAHGDDET